MKAACMLISLQILWLSFAAGSEIKGCLPPVVPYLGRYTPFQATYKPNDTISYECKNGSRIFGSDRRTCKANGIWNPSAPYCSEALSEVSVDEKWETLLDKNYSSCTKNTSVSLSFNYGNFSGGVIIVYFLKSGSINAFTTLNGDDCKNISNREGNFQEFSCPFQAVGNKEQNLTIFRFSSMEFCEVEIYPPKDVECAVLTNSTNMTLRFEPSSENGSVGYGAAVIYDCSDGYHLVGKHVRYCIDNNEWSGNESYCEVARDFTTVARNFTIIVIAVSASSAIVLLIVVTGAVCICKKKCKRKRSAHNQFYSECDSDSKSEDMHYYSIVNYDGVAEHCRKPLPEIPPYEPYEINGYIEPVDAKAESLAGSVYAEPDESYNKCSTAKIVTRTDNRVADCRNQQEKRRAKSLHI